MPDGRASSCGFALHEVGFLASDRFLLRSASGLPTPPSPLSPEAGTFATLDTSTCAAGVVPVSPPGLGMVEVMRAGRGPALLSLDIMRADAVGADTVAGAVAGEDVEPAGARGRVSAGEEEGWSMGKGAGESAEGWSWTESEGGSAREGEEGPVVQSWVRSAGLEEGGISPPHVRIVSSTCPFSSVVNLVVERKLPTPSLVGHKEESSCGKAAADRGVSCCCEGAESVVGAAL